MQISQFIGLSGEELHSLEGPSLPRGAIRLDTSIGSFDSQSLSPLESRIDKDHALLAWATLDGALRIVSDWTCDNATNIWRRSDVLYNTGKQTVVINRALARFLLAPGQYEVYGQNSAWCKENQGAWQALMHGGLVFRCEGGQTCRGASPFVCVREIGQRTGIAFHVIPSGNWTIRVVMHTAKQTPLPFCVVELGMDDEHLRLSLAPEQSVRLPDVLFQAMPEGDPCLAAPALHRYLSAHQLPTARRDPPVVYNTWFDVHEWFTADRVRRQLQVAKRIGCEVFVVDAGWYGAGAGPWYEQVGDWREKQEAAFHSQMLTFANEVRAAGLGFGLWMEPERLGAKVPVVREHPQWFITADGKYFHPNLEIPEVYTYISGEMSRLIATYRLVWMKVDFNFERGVDPTGAEYMGYYRAWYRLLDELRAKYRNVFFEGCSSGGLRLDLATLSHFDAHFLSDTVTPLDVLRIGTGALLRLPPGRVTKWVVLSGPRQLEAGLSVPRLGTRNTVMTPVGATWDRSIPTSADFACRVALPGVFGVSGDVASLPNQALDSLSTHVAFFKKWRNFIVTSSGHLLTPPSPITDSKGWVAIQLQNEASPANLLFAYRLDDAASRMRFRLRDLDPIRVYSVMAGEQTLATLTGRQLMDEGSVIEVPARYEAQILVVAPA